MNEYSKDLAKKYTQGRDEFKDADSRLFEFVQRAGITGKDVLDLGCGDGRYAAKFLEMGGKSARGIDISPAMIELAKERRKSIEFTIGDATDLLYSNDSFDVVFSNFVLQHCKDSQKVFSEIARVLREGGYFIGTFNSIDTDNHGILNQEMPILLGQEDPITVYDLMKLDEEYLDAIKEAGLEVIEYINEPNACAFVDPDFEYYSDINKLKTIACLLKK
ncbi:MAG: class I SAM-dependent methyltransferase [bacterium]